MGTTIIKNGADMPFEQSKIHIGLTQQTFLSPEEADLVNISAHGVLMERLYFRGAVKPHTHDCAEIICLTKGRVNLYHNGVWEEHTAGDVFIVGAGEVHSVINLNPDEDSEQISFFIPTCDGVKNTPFSAFPAEIADFEERRNS